MHDIRFPEATLSYREALARVAELEALLGHSKPLEEELMGKMWAVNVQPHQVLNATGGNVNAPYQAQWKNAPDEPGWWAWFELDFPELTAAGLIYVSEDEVKKSNFMPGIRWLRIPDPPIPKGE